MPNFGTEMAYQGWSSLGRALKEGLGSLGGAEASAAKIGMDERLRKENDLRGAAQAAMTIGLKFGLGESDIVKLRDMMLTGDVPGATQLLSGGGSGGDMPGRVGTPESPLSGIEALRSMPSAEGYVPSPLLGQSPQGLERGGAPVASMGYERPKPSFAAEQGGLAQAAKASGEGLFTRLAGEKKSKERKESFIKEYAAARGDPEALAEVIDRYPEFDNSFSRSRINELSRQRSRGEKMQEEKFTEQKAMGKASRAATYSGISTGHRAEYDAALKAGDQDQMRALYRKYKNDLGLTQEEHIQGLGVAAEKATREGAKFEAGYDLTKAQTEAMLNKAEERKKGKDPALGYLIAGTSDMSIKPSQAAVSESHRLISEYMNNEDTAIEQILPAISWMGRLSPELRETYYVNLAQGDRQKLRRFKLLENRLSPKEES